MLLYIPSNFFSPFFAIELNRKNGRTEVISRDGKAKDFVAGIHNESRDHLYNVTLLLRRKHFKNMFTLS